jgi:hypothetical protein
MYPKPALTPAISHRHSFLMLLERYKPSDPPKAWLYTIANLHSHKFKNKNGAWWQMYGKHVWLACNWRKTSPVDPWRCPPLQRQWVPNEIPMWTQPAGRGFCCCCLSTQAKLECAVEGGSIFTFTSVVEPSFHMGFKQSQPVWDRHVAKFEENTIIFCRNTEPSTV